MEIMNQSFYSRESKEVAGDLLGKKLVKNGMEGYIVETEAYYGKKDPASHASNGKTDRNKLMFEGAGHIYVYICYGVYHLLNITTRSKGRPGAVLIRALEPLKGLKFMQENREVGDKIKLTNGPGKLTQAFDIDKQFNGMNVTRKDSKIKIAKGSSPENIVKSKRIGINEGKDKELRFYIKSNKWVSSKV